MIRKFAMAAALTGALMVGAAPAADAGMDDYLGEIVTVGRVTGEVVRLFDFGFAVRFFEPQDADHLEGLLEAPDEWREVMRRTFHPV